MVWQVQQAKQRFSELLRRARADGPQVVTLHGKDVAVLVSIEEYRRLGGKATKEQDFKEFLLSIPQGDDLDIARDPDTGRVIDFDD
ncbi:MAG: type II toxin-antitoxin system Phd/YefM family antitoxin [Dehalococcoidia bacterium]|nr:type II toxin-antitoxin system Phd/YefM family antitoxin [Dehalococcoidia bacterium]